MARPGMHKVEKRRKELMRQKKQEEKRKKRLERSSHPGAAQDPGEGRSEEGLPENREEPV